MYYQRAPWKSARNAAHKVAASAFGKAFRLSITASDPRRSRTGPCLLVLPLPPSPVSWSVGEADLEEVGEGEQELPPRPTTWDTEEG